MGIVVLPEFVDEITEIGIHDSINDFVGNPHGTLLDGIFFDFQPDGTKSLMFAVEINDRKLPEGFISLDVPPITWAVFTEYGMMPDQIAVKSTSIPLLGMDTCGQEIMRYKKTT